MIVERPGAVRMSAAALLAASVAPLTAMPQSACLSAGASLTPSPVIPTIWPRVCRVLTISYLCSGKTRANPSARSTASMTELLGDAALPSPSPDRNIITSHHFHVQPEGLRLGNRCFGIGARRIHQRDKADDFPRLAIIGTAHAQCAITLFGKIRHRRFVAFEESSIWLRQARDRLRRALGVMANLASLLNHCCNRALVDRVERNESGL